MGLRLLLFQQTRGREPFTIAERCLRTNCTIPCGPPNAIVLRTQSMGTKVIPSLLLT